MLIGIYLCHLVVVLVLGGSGSGDFPIMTILSESSTSFVGLELSALLQGARSLKGMGLPDCGEKTGIDGISTLVQYTGCRCLEINSYSKSSRLL